MELLNKTSPIPLYYQLYMNILADIRSGTLKPGDMLLPETQLMEKYGVSRYTVRHALEGLAREGYLVRTKSKGTIVNNSSPAVGYRNRVKGFSALPGGDVPIALSSKVLAASVIEPPVYIRERMKLDEGAKAFYLKRVRSIQGKPNVYVEDWLDYRFVPGIETVDFATNSLYDTLEQCYNISPYRAERTFECCFADNEEQLTEMKVPKNKPLLRCTSYVYDANDRLIEFYIAVVNGKYIVNE